MRLLLLPLIFFTAPLSRAGPAPNISGMKMIWHDGFSGAAGGSPNRDNWNIIVNLRVNNEVQDYTTSSKNLQISGGETIQFIPWRTATGGWTSGRVESQPSFMPQPGKRTMIQASLRVGDNPSKQGIWPAFWLMGETQKHGTEWPRCGEIDVFEQTNGAMTSYATVHCQQAQGGLCNEPIGRVATTVIPDHGFHSWGLMWDRTSNNWRSEAIIWLRDGVEFHRLTGDQLGDEVVWSTLAHSPYFVLLNVAVGGLFPGPPNDATQDGYGSMLEVSYVAAYESN